MKTDREIFEEWFNIDETINGCRGTSALERDQMFAAWQAGRASILKELADQEPWGYTWKFDDGDFYEIGGSDKQAIERECIGYAGDVISLIPQPTLKE